MTEFPFIGHGSGEDGMDRGMAPPSLVVIAIGMVLALPVACQRESGSAPTSPSGSGDTIVLEDGTAVPLIPRGEATEDDVVAFCGDCHALPQPDDFPRHAWPKEVANGYFFFRHSNRTDLSVPHYSDALAWYESRAPERLDFSDMPSAGILDAESGFERLSVAWSGSKPPVAIASLVLHEAAGSRGILMCDMATGMLWLGDVGGQHVAPVAVAEFQNPCRIRATDLDRNGEPDYLITDLGNFKPADDHDGSLWWCVPTDDGGPWSQTMIQDGLSRPCDACPLDFDQDGDLDLIVAEFGWHKTGRISLLENVTADSADPQYRPVEIDERNGTIDVLPTDINEDGWMDFVGLISQEHELLEAFVNDRQGGWTKRRLGQVDNPGWGASGSTIVDLDGDGDLDMVTSNGDTMDAGMARPVQGITWWENEGGEPYTRRKLTTMPGCYAAVPGDLDGDGDLDIAAVAYLPLQVLVKNPVGTFDSAIWLEQTSPGRFERHFLEEDVCNHVACLLVDWDGDGQIDILTAPCDFDGSPSDLGLTVFRRKPHVEMEERAAAR